MKPTLSGCEARLSRVNERAADLEGRLSLLTSKLYELRCDFKPGSQKGAYVYEPFDDPIMEFGLDLGEIFHGLRATLDNLAHQLVIKYTGLPPAMTSKVAFPICKNLGEFTNRTTGNNSLTLGMDTADITILERLQPYNTGNEALKEPLWVIGQIDNIDKHRVVPATELYTIGGGFTTGAGLINTGIVQLPPKPGAVCWTFDTETPNCIPPAKMNIRIHAETLFDMGIEPAYLQGCVVSTVLRKAVNFVNDDVMPKFRPLFPKP